MTKYIRKLNKQGVWNKQKLTIEPDKILEQIPSDVFSKCMNSTANTLSIWKVEGNNWDDFGDVIATIVSGSDGPNATDLVILDDDLIRNIELDKKPGKTPASFEMNEMHYDICNLTHYKIGVVAKYIGLKLAEDLEYEKQNQPKPSDSGVKRITESKLIVLMKNAIDKGCINKSSLSTRWQQKIEALKNK
ncbi:TPA: hypothetical protein ACGQTX_003002 [Raoultella ornithinolytica]|uniref:hypothetical protein n=1 Tax=Raoultella ornithinolytica TaxID=54291 RepID=UPI000F114BAF|nr:hypothetical protein D9D10_03585 [Raoultella ornithinolytica]HDH7790217.1 hypothetical protein [Raoultella ornithinolytica]